MQYILTQEEYNTLVEQSNRGKLLAKKALPTEELQKLCTKIADTMPVQTTWRPEPWGCILSATEDCVCDDCPVQKICPYENKEFSK